MLRYNYRSISAYQHLCICTSDRQQKWQLAVNLQFPGFCCYTTIPHTGQSFSQNFPFTSISKKSVQNWPKIALSKLQPLQNHNFLTWREIQMVFCPRCQYCSQCNSHHTSLYVTTSTPCTLSCHTIKAECFLEFGLGL